ncbi:MAG: ABC transporter substrate-binding protein, partial [Ktedonobacterales bacterium]
MLVLTLLTHLRPASRRPQSGQQAPSGQRVNPRLWAVGRKAHLRGLETGASVLLLGILLLAGLAACSGVGPDKTLTLGTLLPTSGASSAVGLAMQQAVDLAVKQNAALPNGYSLTDTHLDENSIGGAAAVTTLASNSQLMCIVGPLDSETALDMLPVVEQQGLATITPAATLPGLTQADAAATEGLIFSQLHPKGKPVAFFRLPATDTALGKAAADAATASTASHGLNARAVFVVDDGMASGKALAEAFNAELKAHGGNVVGQATLTVGAQDNTQSIVSAIVEAYPDAVFFAGGVAAGAELRSTLSLTGAPQLPLLITGPAAADPDWSKTVGLAAASAYTTALLPAPDITTLPDATTTKAFTTAYQSA